MEVLKEGLLDADTEREVVGFGEVTLGAVFGVGVGVGSDGTEDGPPGFETGDIDRVSGKSGALLLEQGQRF